MKKRFFRVIGIGSLATVVALISSCNKSNSGTPLPSMMDFMLNKNWRLDTVILMSDAAQDTLTMANVPGFSTSNIAFYNRLDSSFVFRDLLDASLTGPDNRDSIFRYTYGRWGMNGNQDSIYLYSQDTVNARNYRASWAVSRNDSASLLYADYADTIPRAADTVVLKKRVVFVKSTFY